MNKVHFRVFYLPQSYSTPENDEWQKQQLAVVP